MRLRVSCAMGLLFVISATACGVAPLNTNLATASVTPSVTETATSTPMPSAPTELATTVGQVLVESPTPSVTPAPPTLTPTPTQTPGPYEYTIQVNDTLGFIIRQFGYTDLSVGTGSIIDQIVSLNENIVNADILPPPGSVILIPRQTATPTPQNEQTAVVVNATNTAASPNVVFTGNAIVGQYTVQADDTLLSIAELYDTTLAVLSYLNPDLDVFSCNLEIPSGGPGCNVPVVVGQALNIPAPTPTPTLSPTPSGSETPTATPTYAPPVLLSPADGASAPPGIFSLLWVSVGAMSADEYYLVEVTNVTLNEVVVRSVTRQTAFQMPDTAAPQGGVRQEFTWRVWVAKPNAQGVYAPIGGSSVVRRFTWGSG